MTGRMGRLTAKIKRDPSSVVELEYDEKKLFRSVFSGPAGERVLEIILDRFAGIHGPLWKPGATPTDTAYLVGRRDVGLLIAQLVYEADLTTPAINRTRKDE